MNKNEIVQRSTTQQVWPGPLLCYILPMIPPMCTADQERPVMHIGGIMITSYAQLITQMHWAQHRNSEWPECLVQFCTLPILNIVCGFELQLRHEITMDGLLVLIAAISSTRSTTAGRCSHLLIRLSEHGIDTVRLGVVCSITRLTIIPTPTPWWSSITTSTTARSPGRPVTLTWKQIKLYMAHLTKYKKIHENNSGI